jgi:hypothetical protein
MLESGFEQWDGLLFRDYSWEHPDAAREYGDIKIRSPVFMFMTVWPIRRPRETLSGELPNEARRLMEKTGECTRQMSPLTAEAGGPGNPGMKEFVLTGEPTRGNNNI